MGRQKHVELFAIVQSQYILTMIVLQDRWETQQIVYLVVHNLSYECINPAAYPIYNQGHNLHAK